MENREKIHKESPLTRERNLKIFAVAVLFIGFAGGMEGILSNYFKEVYDISAFQRGFIEFPRETPGVLAAFVISGLGFLGDVRIAVISQILMALGMIVLGFFTPGFGFMLVFLFTFSLGQHMIMPLHDGIAVSLSEKGSEGTVLGRMSGLKVTGTMVGSILIFLGFKYDFFTFSNPIIPFVLSAVASAIAAVVLYLLSKRIFVPQRPKEDHKLVVRKEYKYYYLLAILNGVQKQIMIVFGPWVLIELLLAGADTIALLGIIASLMGMFFLPFVGKSIDKFGIRKLMYADAFSFIFVYAAYGLLCSGIISGAINPTIGLFLAGGMFVLDRLSMNLGMVRTMYLKNIALNKGDITKTISLGISMDHVVAITCAMISGGIWTTIGPQYVFYFTALLSIVNVYIAKKVRLKEEK